MLARAHRSTAVAVMEGELRARAHTDDTQHDAAKNVGKKRCVKTRTQRHRREVNTKQLLYPPVVGHVPFFIKIQGRHEPARRLAHGARERLARADAQFRQVQVGVRAVALERSQ